MQQLQERNGSMEIAVVREEDDDNSRHLLWRVRVLAVHDDEIVIEQPSTLGRQIALRDGVELAALFAIGQNRWMFRTRNRRTSEFRLNADRVVPAMHLAAPEHVERCQRRNYYRIETTALNLPEVEVWPLLDPKSVVVAERACEIELNRQRANGSDSADDQAMSMVFEDHMMPEVGPRFTASLLNLGGGGLGLRIEPRDAGTLNRHKLFWLRFRLPPELSTPICATGKLTHSHMDSMQSTYAGLAFDFSFNPGHQEFVVDQICRYIAVQQREQLKRQREVEEPRRVG